MINLTSLYQGGNLRLTGINPENDPAALAEWSQNGLLAWDVNDAPARPLSAWEIGKRLERTEKQMDEENNCFYYHFRPLEAETLLGWGKLDWIAWPSQTAFFQMAIAPSQQRQGFGREAAQLLLRIAFNELNLHRLSLHLPEYNLRGVQFAQRLGFTLEARRRQSIWRENRHWDTLHFGLLRPEWEKGQQS